MCTRTAGMQLCVQGQLGCSYVYQGSWDASMCTRTAGMQLCVPRQLGCSYQGTVTLQERPRPGNYKDPFAVAVVSSCVTIGHVPKKISSVCSYVLVQSTVE